MYACPPVLFSSFHSLWTRKGLVLLSFPPFFFSCLARRCLCFHLSNARITLEARSRTLSYLDLPAISSCLAPCLGLPVYVKFCVSTSICLCARTEWRGFLSSASAPSVVRVASTRSSSLGLSVLACTPYVVYVPCISGVCIHRYSFMSTSLSVYAWMLMRLS